MHTQENTVQVEIVPVEIYNKQLSFHFTLIHLYNR